MVVSPLRGALRGRVFTGLTKMGVMVYSCCEKRDSVVATALETANMTATPPCHREIGAKRVGSTCSIDAGSIMVTCGEQGSTDPESWSPQFQDYQG